MMFVEKADTCPWCSKQLTQIEYDLQKCNTCNTGMDFHRESNIVLVETPPPAVKPPNAATEQFRMHAAQDKVVHILCSESLTSGDCRRLARLLELQANILAQAPVT